MQKQVFNFYIIQRNYCTSQSIHSYPFKDFTISRKLHYKKPRKAIRKLAIPRTLHNILLFFHFFFPFNIFVTLLIMFHSSLFPCYEKASLTMTSAFLYSGERVHWYFFVLLILSLSLSFFRIHIHTHTHSNTFSLLLQFTFSQFFAIIHSQDFIIRHLFIQFFSSFSFFLFFTF